MPKYFQRGYISLISCHIRGGLFMKIESMKPLFGPIRVLENSNLYGIQVLFCVPIIILRTARLAYLWSPLWTTLRATSSSNQEKALSASVRTLKL